MTHSDQVVFNSFKKPKKGTKKYFYYYFFLVLTIFDLFWFLTPPLALIHQWIVIVIVIVPWGKFPLSPSLVRSLFWCFPWPKIPKQTIFHRYKHTASVTSLLFEPSSGVSHNKGMCGEVVRDTSRYVKYGVTCAAFIPHTHQWSVCVIHFRKISRLFMLHRRVCLCPRLSPAFWTTPKRKHRWFPFLSFVEVRTDLNACVRKLLAQTLISYSYVEGKMKTLNH